MGISPADIRNKTGVCVETTRKAIRELESKYYIVWDDDFKYNFYEVPQSNPNNFYLESKKNKWLEVYEKSDYNEIQKTKKVYDEIENDYSWEGT